MPASVKIHEVQFVFLYTTAIKNDFNLYNCITFDFCKIHRIFVHFRVLLFNSREKKKKRIRSTFWKTSEMEWNGMWRSLMANAYGCTIHYVPTDKHTSSLTQFEEPKNIYLLSSLVLTLRKLRYRNVKREWEEWWRRRTLCFRFLFKCIQLMAFSS